MIYILHVGVQTQWNEDDVAPTNDCFADSCDVSLECDNSAGEGNDEDINRDAKVVVSYRIQ